MPKTLTVRVLQAIPNWKQARSEIRLLKSGGVYLYCDNPIAPHQKEFDGHWQAILAQYRQPIKPTVKSWKDHQGVMEILSAQGATTQTVIAAQWTVEETVKELLDRYATRHCGVSWTVSEADFQQAIPRLRQWCREYYGSEDVVLSSDALI